MAYRVTWSPRAIEEPGIDRSVHRHRFYGLRSSGCHHNPHDPYPLAFSVRRRIAPEFGDETIRDRRGFGNNLFRRQEKWVVWLLISMRLRISSVSSKRFTCFLAEHEQWLLFFGQPRVMSLRPCP